jgi:hypothetical protein
MLSLKSIAPHLIISLRCEVEHVIKLPQTGIAPPARINCLDGGHRLSVGMVISTSEGGQDISA